MAKWEFTWTPIPARTFVCTDSLEFCLWLSMELGELVRFSPELTCMVFPDDVLDLR